MTLLADAGAGGHPVWHVLVVVAAPVLVIMALTRYDKIRYARAHGGLPARHRAHRARPGDDRLLVASVASAGAGLTHGLACVYHFATCALFGWFFLGLALAQLAWAAWILWRPTQFVLFAGALGNIAVVALWLVTRTAGLPFGPEPGVAEAVGVPDLLATGFELLTVAMTAAVMRSGTLVPRVRVGPGHELTPQTGV